jgi:tRNA threonylcarbamoyladenosine biosynthesis protein TsaE
MLCVRCRMVLGGGVKTQLADPEAQLAFGERLAGQLSFPCVLYLEGNLGAGKTTLARGILAGLGHRGTVRSPTYTLIEPYELPLVSAYHLDLYRLADPEELEYLGVRDLAGEGGLWLIEWADRGRGMLPEADLVIQIEHDGGGRRLTLTPMTPCGQTLIARLKDGAG